VYRVLEDYIRKKMRGRGYAEVRTPQLMPRELWVRSGHWEKFAGNMFSIDDGERPMALKPISCPCHVQIFNHGLRSWRDLPVRYFEFGAVHRDEPSGSLHGVLRPRAFVQDDAHVFCREEDVESEVARFVRLLMEVYTELGFSNPEVALSTRPAVRSGTDELWDWTEKTLGDVAGRCGFSPRLLLGGGAFYGPKLEFALGDRVGRSWQCGTVQLDCVLPARLEAAYVAPDGSRAIPLMIHHAVLGSLERFTAVLVEHYGGALPFWLSPEQVVIAPISQQQSDYAAEVVAALEDAGIRTALYDQGETLSRRIVTARDAQVPVMAVLGRREKAARTVTLRERDGTQAILSLPDAVAMLSKRR